MSTTRSEARHHRADVAGFTAYREQLRQYVAGTGTLEALTAAVTPGVAVLISQAETAAAQRRKADREHEERAARRVRASRRASRLAYVVVAVLLGFWVFVIVTVAHQLDGQAAAYQQRVEQQIVQQRIERDLHERADIQWQLDGLTPEQQHRLILIQRQLLAQEATP